MRGFAVKAFVRALSIVGAVVLLSGFATGVAAAATRYAGPDGTQPTCSDPANPCSLPVAIAQAVSGDEVVVLHGHYSLAAELIDPGGITLNIHGEYGQPRPVIDSTAVIALAVQDVHSTVGYLDLRDAPATGPGTALAFAGSVAEQILARAPGPYGAGACYLLRGTLRDSVCSATTGYSVFIDAVGTADSVTLRNVTAYNQIGQTAIEANNSASSPVLNVSLVNVIAHAVASVGSSDIYAQSNTGGPGLTMTIQNSNYHQALAPNGATIVTPDPAGNQIDTPPQLADPANFDFHELATSPTVNAGLADPDPAHVFDLDRGMRLSGGATDIGAYEMQVPVVIPTPIIPGPIRDVAPVLKQATITKRFAVKLAHQRRKHGIHYGASLHFSLSKAAKLTGTVARKTTGRLVGHSCKPATAKNHKARACVRWVSVAPYAVKGKLGTNKVAFSGKLKNHALKPGSYRLRLVASDPAKLRSHVATVTFTVVRG